MKWNEHLKFEDKHAFLSPSQHTWLRYDTDTLKTRYYNSQAKQRGTELHEFAASCIKLRKKLGRQAFCLFLIVAFFFQFINSRQMLFSIFANIMRLTTSFN
jgi:hypothetical protein